MPPRPRPRSIPRPGSLHRPARALDSDGRPVDVGGQAGVRVLVRPHTHDCQGCRTLVRRIEGEAGDGRGGLAPIVVLIETGRDADGWVAVTDEWGEVFHAVAVGTDHATPTPTEIAEWVRFVSMQCPECESPEGRWLTVRSDAEPS